MTKKDNMKKKEKTVGEASGLWRYRYYILIPICVITLLAALLLLIAEDEQTKPFVYAVF